MPLQWPTVCVGFSLQRDGSVNLPLDQARPAIEASFVGWSDLDCGGGERASIAFSELDDVSCHLAEYDEDAPNANVILFQDTMWRYHGDGNTVAKTTVTFDEETGEILDADIEINHAYNELTVSDDNVVYDLQSIVTHEIGHFIGFDHSSDSDATMFASYDEGSIEPRTLEADDVDAVCAVYPPDRGGDCDPEPQNGLGDACAGDAAKTEESTGCSASPGSARGAWALSLAILASSFPRRLGRRARRDAAARAPISHGRQRRPERSS